MKRSVFVVVAAASVLAAGPHALQGQARVLRISPSSTDAVLDWDNSIDWMIRDRTLRVQTSAVDALVPGRQIERIEQLHNGVRVWGASVVRQLESGRAVSVFGTLYADAAIETTPSIDAEQAKVAIEAIGGATLGPGRLPSLALLPQDGGFRLVWIGRIVNARGGIRLFIDARTGREVKRQAALERQAPNAFVGHGRGVLGDDKKLSTDRTGGGFVLLDTLRPPNISTFNMYGNLSRLLSILNGLVSPGMADLGFSTTNTWDDTALVDAHAYSSDTYDYYYKRFGRRGMDGNDRRLWNFVHPVNRNDVFDTFESAADFYVNAFYDPDTNVMVYGEGLPGGVYLTDGHFVDFQSGAIDVVAHELTHGVTHFSSDLVYEGESGALNESFSDIMGTSVEFFFQQPGTDLMNADYFIGEDTWRAATYNARSGIRSMADPSLFGDPDHYSKRYTGTEDNGGVHTNSGISNHAFYLAIEGGTNRTSGIRVQGVGAANREQIEKVFYRAFTQLLPANATFSIARAATLRAAQDLYGLNSAAYNAVRDAWTAVGVN